MSKLKKALQKAKEIRESDGKTPIRHTNIYQKETKSGFENLKEFKSELKVKYSETKVKKIDDRILKNGNIISLFHDFETVHQIKTLRIQILNKLKELKGNSLLITSANPYEGKTFTAINLGVSIAQELDKTVLLVDCDLKNHSSSHKSFCSDFFGTPMDEGLSSYLLGQAELEDLLVNPGIERLVLLPAGRPLQNSSEMLASPRMAMLVKDIKNRYPDDRIIIFDSSSILTTADPLVLTRFIDGILLVVENEKTTIEDIKKVTELLKDKPVIGTVMNKTKSMVN